VTSTVARPLFAPGLALLATFAVACGGARVAPDETPVAEYHFEPVLVSATFEDDGSITTTSRELPEIFAEANDYLRADDYSHAIELYRTVLDQFPEEDDYIRVTHYNIGLAWEGLGEWDQAAYHYATVLDRWVASEDATWSYFRLAECRAHLGQWDEVPTLMQRARDRVGLAHIDHLETWLREANALLELRRYPEAEAHYAEVLAMNDRAARAWDPETSDPDAEPLPEGHAIIAHAHFGRGRVYHELLLEIRLVLPEEQMIEDLVDKGQLLEQAQEAYLDAVRTGHRYWAPAAGYMTGQMYEDMHFDVLAAEVPDRFNELEVEVYFEMLREQTRNALEQAVDIYESNLAMAYRLGSDNLWVEETLQSIRRVQAYLFEQEGWAEEERLILEGRHPRSAGFADDMVFRSELERRGQRAAMPTL